MDVIAQLSVQCSLTLTMTIMDEKRSSQNTINEDSSPDNAAHNALDKCRLAAGLFINDEEVPWLNFEKVFLFLEPRYSYHVKLILLLCKPKKHFSKSNIKR